MRTVHRIVLLMDSLQVKSVAVVTSSYWSQVQHASLKPCWFVEQGLIYATNAAPEDQKADTEGLNEPMEDQ